MSWLAKIGKVLQVVGQVVVNFGPLTALTPSKRDDVLVEKTLDSLSHATGIIASVEGIGVALQLSGPQKLQAAKPLIRQLLLQTDALIGHKIDDPVAFDAAVEAWISAWVGILNSVKDDIKTDNRT